MTWPRGANVRCGYDNAEVEAEDPCSSAEMPNRSASALGGAIVSRTSEGSGERGRAASVARSDPRWEISFLHRGKIFKLRKRLGTRQTCFHLCPRRPSLLTRPTERERGAVGDVLVSDPDVAADIGHGAVPAQGPDPRNNRRRSNFLPPLLCHPVPCPHSLSPHNALTAASNRSSMNSIRIRPAPPASRAKFIAQALTVQVVQLSCLKSAGEHVLHRLLELVRFPLMVSPRQSRGRHALPRPHGHLCRNPQLFASHQSARRHPQCVRALGTGV